MRHTLRKQVAGILLVSSGRGGGGDDWIGRCGQISTAASKKYLGGREAHARIPAEEGGGRQSGKLVRPMAKVREDDCTIERGCGVRGLLKNTDVDV